MKGYVRGFDVRTGKRLWIFHTIPKPGEFGNDTWEKDSWSYTGNTGVWGQISGRRGARPGLSAGRIADRRLLRRPSSRQRLFGESLVAVDLKTGKRKWHYQFVHHGIWDLDIPCAPILADITVNGRTIKAVAQPTKQGFLYVFDRDTGQPVWPIVERPVPKGDVPGEWYSPTQPFPTKPPAYDRQGVVDRRSDRLHAGAARRSGEARSRYKIGPIFTPPVVSKSEGPLGDADAAGAAAAPTGRAARTIRRRTPSTSIRRARQRSLGAGRAAGGSPDMDYIQGRRGIGRAADRRIGLDAAGGGRTGESAGGGAGCRRRRREGGRRADGAGTAADQAAVRPHHARSI